MKKNPDDEVFYSVRDKFPEMPVKYMGAVYTGVDAYKKFVKEKGDKILNRFLILIAIYLFICSYPVIRQIVISVYEWCINAS